jgi:hypothetical protein
MKHPEQALQISIVRALRVVLPPDTMVVAYPSGGGGRTRGAILKGMGLAAGFPDLMIIHHGMAFGMELKSKTGQLSAAQRAMHKRLANCGMDVRVVRSLDQALTCLAMWGMKVRTK